LGGNELGIYPFLIYNVKAAFVWLIGVIALLSSAGGPTFRCGVALVL